MSYIHCIICIALTFILLPAMFYICAKMISYGWLRGKQLFYRDNPTEDVLDGRSEK